MMCNFTKPTKDKPALLDHSEVCIRGENIQYLFLKYVKIEWITIMINNVLLL